MLRARRAVVVAAHHRLEDLEHRLRSLDAGVVGPATLVRGVGEQLGDAGEVAEVDALGVAVHDVLDRVPGVHDPGEATGRAAGTLRRREPGT